MRQLEVAAPVDSELRHRLKGHPGVILVEGAAPTEGLAWRQNGAWHRRLTVGDARCEVYGLVETMDNNPMVCADVVSVPSPGVMLALIALNPLIWGGLLVESPALMTSVPIDEAELREALARVGWSEDVQLSVEALELEGCAALTALAAVHTPANLAEIDALYEEAYGRSFYVREALDSEPWNVGLVKGTPRAVYRLRITPDEPTSLLTVQVLADRSGKLGAGGLVHAMNVMAGFEESVGV